MFGKDSIYKKIIKLLDINGPLVVFDVQTTGLAISTDKIVELAYVKVWPNGRIKRGDIMLNPEMNISLEATAVHGIKNEDIQDKPTFRDKSQEIWDIFNDSHYSGFNVANFDLPIIRREFVRVGMDFDYDEKRVIDSRVLFNYMAPRSLSMAYEHYCKKQFKHDYNAVLDTDSAAEILMRQLEKYEEVRNIKFINSIQETSGSKIHTDNVKKIYWIDGIAHFAFSKYKDKTVKQVSKEDPAFLKWILEAEFPREVKNIVRIALEGEGK